MLPSNPLAMQNLCVCCLNHIYIYIYIYANILETEIVISNCQVILIYIYIYLQIPNLMGGHDLGTQRSSFRISSSFSDKTPRSGTQALGAVIWSDEKPTEL